jgi:hypothetical protein
MDGNEIENYLRALDDELGKKRNIRKPVRLAVVGGVYMVFVLKNRASTKDIDIMPLDFPDTTHPNQETRAFQAAVHAVAKAHKIKRDWMNDVVTAFSPELDSGSLILWRSYTHLQVYVPQVDFILVLKLLAGRDRDEDDILALCKALNIQTREQAQALVDRYTDQRWQQECNLEATLDALF